jgi:GNAT superfamily N-acetyltransferase
MKGQGDSSEANMDEILKDLSAPSLVTALEANLFEFFKLFEQWPRAEVHDDPDMLRTITDIPFPMFNSVFRAHLSNPDAAIEAAIARCRRRNVPMMWWTGPSTQPTELRIALEAFGFTGEEVIGMAADLRSLPREISLPRGLVIERVGDVETMKKWCRVLCVGFEMPDFVGEAFLDFFRSIGFASQSTVRHYIGCLNDEPVSASSMFLGAGVAGIYCVATVPEVRKRGVGSAATLMPLHEARILGYQIGILHSTRMGVNVYHGLGFREYCKILQYVWLNQQAGK